MHELSITQSMFDLVLDQAKKEKTKKIGKINLIIGEMTGVAAESVQFYFGFLNKGTIAEEASLCIKTVPAKARCRSCNQTSELKEFEWTCPNCKSDSLEIVAGRELFVESIEVE